MPPMSSLALMASIIASVMGALIVCVLVFRYGFTIPAASDADAGPSPTDVLITRIGHAVAGACFAATAVLAVVALSMPARERGTARAVSPPATAQASASASGAQSARRADVDIAALRRRLAEAESQLARLEDEVHRTPPPRAAAVARQPAPARARTHVAGSTHSSVVATEPPGRGEKVLATTRKAWEASRERAVTFAGDVRTALTRVEQTVVRYVGPDPHDRQSARD